MLEQEFTSSLKKLLPKKGKIACAVSGGIDSMAMALLAVSWAKENKVEMVALTVDHGIRKEAKNEAKQVAKWLEAKKISHHILTYKGKKPRADMMNAAREIRYGLLNEWCKKNKIKYLLVAHNLEDQAETFLIRLERGSGVDGLSSIPEKSDVDGITILRPLLGTSRTELQKYLEKQKQKWIEDPTNRNTKYKRNEIRELLFSVAKDDRELLVKRLSDTAINMQRARSFLEQETAKYKDKCLVTEKERAVLDMKKYKELHEEIAFRIISGILKKISGKTYPPRFENLRNLHYHMISNDFKGATLWNCKIQPGRKKKELGKIIITPE